MTSGTGQVSSIIDFINSDVRTMGAHAVAAVAAATYTMSLHAAERDLIEITTNQ